MAHVGVERLCAGHAQKHRAEHGEAEPAMREKKADALARVEGVQTPAALRRICMAPSTPMTMKKTIMIGPKKAATRAVP